MMTAILVLVLMLSGAAAFFTWCLRDADARADLFDIRPWGLLVKSRR